LCGRIKVAIGRTGQEAGRSGGVEIGTQDTGQASNGRRAGQAGENAGLAVRCLLVVSIRTSGPAIIGADTQTN